MSYSVFHGVAIGYLISIEKNVVNKQERTCHHDTDTSKKFCSECGQPVYHIVETTILSPEEKYDNFSVKEYGDLKNRYYAIGLINELKEVSFNLESSIKKFPKDLQIYATELKNELEVYNIQVPLSTFGVHSIVSI